MPSQQALLATVPTPRAAIVSASSKLPAKPSRQLDRLKYAARLSDLVMLCTMYVSAATAVGISMIFYETGLVAVCAAVLLLVGTGVYAAARGSVFSSFALTACNVLLVVLHIQASHGQLEFHFGVFVLLGMLLMYRDWRVLLFAAGLFAVHHVLFDRLQAMALGVYCTPAPDFLRIVLHAVYVVIQTGVEIFLAVRLRHAAVEAAELLAIVGRIDQGTMIGLDVERIEVSEPTSRTLQAAIAKMGGALREVGIAAAQVDQASEQIVGGTHTLGEHAQELRRTVAVMEEITQSVAEAADTANLARTLARDASSTAQESSHAVSQVEQTMQGISKSSERISEITTMIDGIAFQTNILALNAAVEAARAGDAGRGFAVVATEVRQLAQRAGSAAKDIRGLITESTDRVREGMQLVGAAHGEIDRLADQSQRVSVLIDEISVAAGNQAEIVNRVGEIVGDLDRVTQQSGELVSESSHVADHLQDQAARLNAVVGRFVLS